MKKITLVALAFGALSFASCKKAVTCSCTSTTTDSGTKHDVNMISPGVYGEDTQSYTEATQTGTSATELNKVSKKFQNENCPKTTTNVVNYDYTDTYTTAGVYKADRSGTLLDGNKGTKTTTTTCEIK